MVHYLGLETPAGGDQELVEVPVMVSRPDPALVCLTGSVRFILQAVRLSIVAGLCVPLLLGGKVGL